MTDDLFKKTQALETPVPLGQPLKMGNNLEVLAFNASSDGQVLPFKGGAEGGGSFPLLRFPQFTDNWQQKKLGEVLKHIAKNRVLNTKNYQKLTIKLNLRGVEQSFIEREMADTRPFYQRKAGEIIIGKQNYFNGSIAIIPKEFDGFICSNAIMSYDVSNEANTTFIYTYISRQNYLKEREVYANGTGQKELSEKDFLNFSISLPSLPEQEKIAGFLGCVDEKIENLKSKKAKLLEYKKALMQQMFCVGTQAKDPTALRSPLKVAKDTQVKTPVPLGQPLKMGNNLEVLPFNASSDGQVLPFKGGAEGGGSFPLLRFPQFTDNWQEKKLGEVMVEYSDKNNKDLNEVVSVGKYGIRKRSEIYSKELSSDISKNKVIRKDTLTIGMGSTQIDIGILQEDVVYSVSPAYSTFKINNVNTFYFNYYLQEINYILSDAYMITGARQGKSVNKKDLLSHSISLPSLPEQEKIAGFLGCVDTKIADTQTQIDKTILWKKGLMQQMFV